MIKGLYTAASGLLAQQLAAETLADNVANVGTTGFKRRTTEMKAFPEMLLKRMDAGKSREVGVLNTGAEVYGTPIHHTQGSTQQTGNPLDLAIEGEGFFPVQLSNGQTAYTRSGNFRLNEVGQLATQQGELVLDASNNPIEIPPDAGLITITSHGSIQSNSQGEIAQLGLAVFDKKNSLEKLGGTLYTSAVPPRETLPPGSQKGVGSIQQGYLEQSNVKILAEMVQLITSQRLVESLQKSIQMQNQTLGKAVNEVAKP